MATSISPHGSLSLAHWRGASCLSRPVVFSSKRSLAVRCRCQSQQNVSSRLTICLVVMIEDPHEAERRRQMGNESGCSCDEIADAFREFRDISITPSSPLTALPALSPHCPPRPFPSLPSPSSPLTAPPALSPHSPPRPSPSLPSPPFPLTALPALPLRFPPRPFFSLPSPPFPLVSMPVPLCVPLPHPLRVRGPADRLVLVLRQLRTFPFLPSHRALSTPLSPPPSHPPLSPTLLAVPLSPTLLALPLSPTLLSPLGQPLPGYSECQML
ncbi:unnamed protein product [Closterium sp. NIES-64]|nr:unnamed protein product [Closterium sp. NIES-64]